MKIEKLRCDRCGIEDATNKRQHWVVLRVYGATNSLKMPMTTDLCPVCVQSLDKWIACETIPGTGDMILRPAVMSAIIAWTIRKSRQQHGAIVEEPKYSNWSAEAQKWLNEGGITGWQE